MASEGDHSHMAEEAWRSYMTTGKVPPGITQPWYSMPWMRHIARHLPSEPRCEICYYPFEGAGGKLVKMVAGVERSRLNPRMCNLCENFAQEFPGGAEIEATLLFADVRGSSGLAERMSALAFSRLIDRFYQTATRIIFSYGGMVEKLVGDEVTAFFVPAFSPEGHARAAVAAARDILEATGRGAGDGQEIPIGAGIHTGVVYIGTVGRKGEALDIAVLGDNANIAARLASQARAGEILISEATRAAAGLEAGGMEGRRLELKGKEEAIDVWGITLS